MALLAQLAAAPATPSGANTYARWSAAEAPNGGLDANGNWASVDGSKTLTRAGATPVYGASVLNAKPGISTSAGAWYLDAVSLLNNSAAVIMLLSTQDALTVLHEFGQNTNNNPGTFSSYIEEGRLESTINPGGGLFMRGVSVSAVNAPYLLSSRYYVDPTSIDMQVNGVASFQVNPYATVSNLPGFGTHILNVCARDKSQYPTNGTIAVYHLFHTAPNDADWAAWISYYKNLYGLS